ncbi:MAG: ferritin-like domain-containing protein [Acidobacteria bacterium]|nr:ferritin-like domain-containing protein [Acidobacteriota bacterium]
MKIFSANLKNLEELYTASLKKTLDMEQQLTKVLPTMIEKTTDPELRSGLQRHLSETEGHVQRVESMLMDLTGDNDTETCKVMSALATEGSDMLTDADNEQVCDVSIIAACQQVEHHEIAIYGTLRSWADLLGRTNDAAVLEQILEEEKNADRVLSMCSDKLNVEADMAA